MTSHRDAMQCQRQLRDMLEDVLDRDDSGMDESERARAAVSTRVWRNGAGRPAHWLCRQPAPARGSDANALARNRTRTC